MSRVCIRFIVHILHSLTGFRAASFNGKGYTLFVDGLYQGRYIDHIDVIGGGATTYMLLTQPKKWSNVLR